MDERESADELILNLGSSLKEDIITTFIKFNSYLNGKPINLIVKTESIVAINDLIQKLMILSFGETENKLKASLHSTGKSLPKNLKTNVDQLFFELKWNTRIQIIDLLLKNFNMIFLFDDFVNGKVKKDLLQENNNLVRNLLDLNVKAATNVNIKGNLGTNDDRKSNPAVKSNKNSSKSARKRPIFLDSDSEDDLMKRATANTSLNSLKMIPVNYSKENSSKPRTSSSLLNVSSDFIADEKIKYEVEMVCAGTYWFLSRSYFCIGPSQITLNLSSKKCLNIDYKCIKLLSLSEAKKDEANIIYIKIDFAKETVDEIKAFINKLPGTNGIFEYESINAHEKHFIMKLECLKPDDTLFLKKKLRTKLQKNYKEDPVVSCIFEYNRTIFIKQISKK